MAQIGNEVKDRPNPNDSQSAEALEEVNLSSKIESRKKIIFVACSFFYQ